MDIVKGDEPQTLFISPLGNHGEVYGQTWFDN